MKILFALVIVMACAGLFWFLGPPHLTDKLRGVVTMGADERKCFNFFKDTLRCPDSAYLESSNVRSRALADKYNARSTFSELEKYEAVIVLRVRSKNAFGAYEEASFTCPLVKGAFDETEAILYRGDEATAAPGNYSIASIAGGSSRLEHRALAFGASAGNCSGQPRATAQL